MVDDSTKYAVVGPLLKSADDETTEYDDAVDPDSVDCPGCHPKERRLTQGCVAAASLFPEIHRCSDAGCVPSDILEDGDEIEVHVRIENECRGHENEKLKAMLTGSLQISFRVCKSVDAFECSEDVSMEFLSDKPWKMT